MIVIFDEVEVLPYKLSFRLACSRLPGRQDVASDHDMLQRGRFASGGPSPFYEASFNDS